MKSKLLYICAVLTAISILLISCKETEDTTGDTVLGVEVPVEQTVPGIDEAVWDLYPAEPLMMFMNNAVEKDKEALSSEWDSAETICELTQEWTQLDGFTFVGTPSTQEHIPYTLSTAADVKRTSNDTEASQSTREYIFLEYSSLTNSFSVKGGYSRSVRKNGFYETVEITEMSEECAENRFIQKLQSLGVQNPPVLNELTQETQPKTSVRRYNHKPVNADEMCLSAFPETTILDILSRFDDAYGELFGNPDEEYSLVSFDCYAEYDWLASSRLNEFTDGTDNTQPYTYSAVYNVKDADGISLVARLDLFVEIEPKKLTLSLIESVFSINYAGELVFEDIHNLEETVLLLDTIVMYHPEDVVVTPTTEQVEEQLSAEDESQNEQSTPDTNETEST